MPPRVYSSAMVTASRCQLEGAEAHHLLNVLRVAAGDPVVVFDGSGDEFTGQIVAAERGVVEVKILERCAVDRELARPLTLGVALPKGDRQRWMIEKCVELGVTELRPLVTRRSVAEASSRAIERCERYVIEASKQCGRNRLMQIGSPWQLSASDASSTSWTLGDAAADAAGRCPARWIADPSATIPCAAAMAEYLREGSDSSANSNSDSASRGAIVVIGPEGGWTREELQAAQQAGWTPIGLGPSVLRVETAALAVAATWNALLCAASALPSKSDERR